MTRRHKLVWFVPREALEATRDAVFAAGAGRSGDLLYPLVELEP